MLMKWVGGRGRRPIVLGGGGEDWLLSYKMSALQNDIFIPPPPPQFAYYFYHLIYAYIGSVGK